MAERLFPMVAAGFLLAVAFVPPLSQDVGMDRLSTGGESSPDGASRRIHYPAQAAALHDQWVTEGAITIQVPTDPTIAPDGELRVIGTSVDLFEEHWEYTHEDGNTSYGGPMTSTAVDGTVDGFPGSTSRLLIGEDGLYGTIEIPSDDGTSYTLSFDVGDPGPSEANPGSDEDDQSVTLVQRSDDD